MQQVGSQVEKDSWMKEELQKIKSLCSLGLMSEAEETKATSLLYELLNEDTLSLDDLKYCYLAGGRVQLQKSNESANLNSEGSEADRLPCPNKQFGCKLLLSSSEISSHMENCLHCIVKCPKCSAFILRQQWKSHFLELHQSEERPQIVHCVNVPCTWSGKADEAASHALNCSFYKIKCLMCPSSDLGEPVFILKSDYQEHLLTHKPKSVIDHLLSCVNPSCTVQLNRFELHDHMNSCMYECEFCQYPLRRQEFYEHLETVSLFSCLLMFVISPHYVLYVPHQMHQEHLVDRQVLECYASLFKDRAQVHNG